MTWFWLLVYVVDGYGGTPDDIISDDIISPLAEYESSVYQKKYKCYVHSNQNDYTFTFSNFVKLCDSYCLTSTEIPLLKVIV